MGTWITEWSAMIGILSVMASPIDECAGAPKLSAQRSLSERRRECGRAPDDRAAVLIQLVGLTQHHGLQVFTSAIDQLPVRLPVDLADATGDIVKDNRAAMGTQHWPEHAKAPIEARVVTPDQ